MRSKFDEQLTQLHKELITMGALCEESIAMAAQALTEGNLQTAEQIFDLTLQVRQKEREIESRCMRLLLQQQPVAKDLRLISSALKMVTDMERIGVNSGDIAEILLMRHITAADDTLNIQDMALAAIKMVTQSIDAFVKLDTELAKAVIAYDDVVDEHFDWAKGLLLELLQQNAVNGEYAMDLAKWVLFAITGQKDG